MKMAKNICPLEAVEQSALVSWLEAKRLKFTAIPNGSYSQSWSVRMRNKRMGLRAGLPDILVVIPADRCRLGRAVLCFIELKRRKGGKVSEDQRCWIEALEEVRDVGASVCAGAEKAIESINTLLNGKV